MTREEVAATVDLLPAVDAAALRADLDVDVDSDVIVDDWWTHDALAQVAVTITTR